jgi:hypothetical protein
LLVFSSLRAVLLHPESFAILPKDTLGRRPFQLFLQ